jgi:hypothetical protein
MQMQERAAPAAITTVARDLDPSAERAIMRCLHPDPRQRPASALSVAAALPGGDPLAAALAAGETPSPDLVAAAGETDGLEPKIAVAWLAAALVLIGAAMIIGPRFCITSKLNLENSPIALTRDARTYIRNFGYTAKPADSAWGLEYADDYKAYAASHPKEAEARWRNPTAGQPPLIHFWYRESPQPLSAKRPVPCVRDYDDPPFDQSACCDSKPTRTVNSPASKPSHPRWKSRPHPLRHSIGTSSSWPPGSIPRNFRPPNLPGLRSPIGTLAPPGPGPTPPLELNCASKPPPGAAAPCSTASSVHGPSQAA